MPPWMQAAASYRLSCRTKHSRLASPTQIQSPRTAATAVRCCQSAAASPSRLIWMLAPPTVPSKAAAGLCWPWQTQHGTAQHRPCGQLATSRHRRLRGRRRLRGHHRRQPHRRQSESLLGPGDALVSRAIRPCMPAGRWQHAIVQGFGQMAISHSGQSMRPLPRTLLPVSRDKFLPHHYCLTTATSCSLPLGSWGNPIVVSTLPYNGVNRTVSQPLSTPFPCPWQACCARSAPAISGAASVASSSNAGCLPLDPEYRHRS